jgi:hypothetical protein
LDKPSASLYSANVIKFAISILVKTWGGEPPQFMQLK